MPLNVKDLQRFMAAKPRTIQPPRSEMRAVLGQERSMPDPAAATPPTNWQQGHLITMIPPQLPVAGQSRVAAMRDLAQQLAQLENCLRTATHQLSTLRARAHALQVELDAAPAGRGH